MRICFPRPPFQGSDWTVHEYFAVDLRLFLFHPIIMYYLWHSQRPPYPNWSMWTNSIVTRQRFRHANIPGIVDPVSHPATIIFDINKFFKYFNINETFWLDFLRGKKIKQNKMFWVIQFDLNALKHQRNEKIKWNHYQWKCEKPNNISLQPASFATLQMKSYELKVSVILCCF